MIIKGEKIILRPLKTSDALIFVKWSRDKEITKFLSLKNRSLKEEKKWIKWIAKDKQQKYFTIEADNETIIGNTVLTLNKKHKHAIWRIIIGDKNYWNKGYGTEAATLILNYGFKKLKLHRIELNVTSYNLRAIHIYKKLGFKLEGVKREHVFYHGKFHDHFLMGILRKEWEKKLKFKKVLNI